MAERRDLEVLYAVVRRDVRELPSSVGFVVPFLVGAPGDANLLGVFPSGMGDGYREKLTEGLMGLGLNSCVTLYIQRISVQRDAIERNGGCLWVAMGPQGAPMAVFSKKPEWCAASFHIRLCEIGRLYLEDPS